MRRTRSSPWLVRTCNSIYQSPASVACAVIVSGSFGAGLRLGAKVIIPNMSSSHRDKCKAKFKKGQRCLLPKFTMQGAEEMLLFMEGEILRAEKRTIEVDNAPVASYHYRVHYVDDGKQYDDWQEESELYKFNADLLSGEESLVAEQARQHAWQQHDFRKAQARLEKIPERLRLRIPVALKKCIVEDYERVCVCGIVDGVRPRVRRSRDTGVGAEAMEVDVDIDMDEKSTEGLGGESARDGDGDGEARKEEDAAAATTTSEREPHALHDDLMKDMSVQEIIKMWRTSMINKDEIIQDDLLAEGIQIVAEGLLTYFNQGARQFLLYAPEVPLYDAIFVKKRKRSDGGDGGDGGDDELEPADVYGVKHLVRLLVKLPDLVCVQMMALPVESARYVVAVEDWLMELMEFLVAEFFPDKQADRGAGGKDGKDGSDNRVDHDRDQDRDGVDEVGSEDEAMRAA